MGVSVSGQGVEEAIRHSLQGLGGSTRSLGSANAIGAIGGSSSAALINPASLAQNRKSELHFGLNFNSINTNSSYLSGLDQPNFSTGVGLSNLFLTIQAPVRDEMGRKVSSGLNNVVISMGYNRTMDYRSSFVLNGDNNQNSFTDFLAEEANGTDFTKLNIYGLPYIAFETYLIEPKNAFGDSFSSVIRSFNTNVNQEVFVDRRGSGGDFNFSISADIDQIVYLGGGLLIRRSYFNESLVFRETDRQPLSDTNDYAGLEYIRFLETRTSGAGVNLGIMVKANSNLRLGLSFASAIRTNARDRYTQSIVGLYDGNRDPSIPASSITRTTPDEDLDGAQDTLQYRYRIRTPGRLTMSAAYVFDKLGFISVDVERVNFATAQLSPRDDTYLFTQENSDIRRTFKPVYNVRLGGEMTYGKFRFRAGYALQPSVFQANGVSQTTALNNNYYTLGFGYHEKNYTLNAALMMNSTQLNYQPYELKLQESPSAGTVRSNYLSFQFGATIVVD